MKKLILFTIAIFAIALLSQSCEKEQTQSELTLESITGFAKISGKFMYDKGAVVDGQTNLVAAEGQTVLLTIPYSNYESSLSGNKVFADTIAADGTFAFDSIPMPAGSTFTGVNVSVAPFYTSYSEAVDGKIVTIEKASYSLNSGSFNLIEGSVMEAGTQIIETSTIIEVPQKSIKITGEVFLYGEKNDNGSVTATSIPAPPCSATITLSENNSYEEIKYVAEVNNGKYEIQKATFPGYWNNSNVTIKVEIDDFYLADKFIHYYWEMGETGTDFLQQTVAGTYSTNSTTSSTLTVGHLEGGTPFTLNTMRINFAPSDKSAIKGIGQEIDFTDEGSTQIYEYANTMSW